MDELSLSDYNQVIKAVDLKDEFSVNTTVDNTKMRHIRRDMLKRMSYCLGIRKDIPEYAMTGKEIEFLLVCLDERIENTQNPKVKEIIPTLKKYFTELLDAVNEKEHKQKAIDEKKISEEQFNIITSHRIQEQKNKRLKRLKSEQVVI